MLHTYASPLIIAAKFNCSVPGTLTTNSPESECAQLVTNDKDLATPSLSSPTLVVERDQTVNSSTLPPTEFIISLILVIVGGVIIIVMICAMVLFRNCRKGSNVVAQPQNQGITVFLFKS